jgi:hypothetical protein
MIISDGSKVALKINGCQPNEKGIVVLYGMDHKDSERAQEGFSSNGI